MTKKTVDKKDMTARNQIPLEIRNGAAKMNDGSIVMTRSLYEIRKNSAVEKEEDGKKYRSFDVVWTTGAPVRRYDWWNDREYLEELVVSEEAVDLDRLNRGASLLNNHWSYELRDVLGSVERAWIEGGVGYATIKFSNREEVDGIWQDVQDGIIRHISVGYSQNEIEHVKRDGELDIYRITRWTPHELSLVAIPADSGCAVRSMENETPVIEMESKVSDKTETPAATTVDANEIRASERKRVSEINTYARTMKVDETIVARAIDEGHDLGWLAREHTNAVAKSAEETNVNTTRAQIINQRSPQEELSLRAEALVATSMTRTGMKAPALSEKAREFAGEGIRGIAEAVINLTGGNVRSGARDSEVISSAFEIRSGIGSNEISMQAALEQPVRAILETKYEEAVAETNYEQWTGSTTVSNFKVNEVVHTGFFTGIRDIAEGGQLPLARLGSDRRFFQIGSRGLMISLTREAIINDDFDSFMRAVGKLGMIYKHDEQGIAVAALKAAQLQTANGIEPIFGAQFGNEVNIPALDDDGMSIARLALRKQSLPKEVYGETSRGAFRVNIEPRVIIVSPDLETAAMRLTGVITPNKAADVSIFGNGRLQYAVLDELDENQAYLTGSSRMNEVFDSVRLAGSTGPQINRLTNGSALKAEWETFNDFTVVGTGRLGVVKINVGATGN